ncbi:hypothetical protein MBGDN05_00349, partial [Thermoplasmatales archaeon SCGC AB-539-N05]
MRWLKRVSILFITVFLISSILPQATAQPTERERLIDKALMWVFHWSYDSLIGTILFPPMSASWKAFRFTEPEFFAAYPNSVDIEYLDETKIIIGSKNETTGNYKSAIDDYNQHPLFPSEFFTFELIFPEGIPKDAWTYTFDPPLLIMGEEGEIKTKLRIASNIPQNLTVSQDLLFRVNVSNYKTGGNLYLPPKGQRGLNSIFWFLMSISPANPFGKLYSGKTTLDFS